jgi:hypothetical protein
MMTPIARIKEIMLFCWHYKNTVLRKSVRKISRKPQNTVEDRFGDLEGREDCDRWSREDPLDALSRLRELSGTDPFPTLDADKGDLLIIEPAVQ